ncbi:MAG: DUF1996 domain-containing protein [Nakamurella sp.]
MLIAVALASAVAAALVVSHIDRTVPQSAPPVGGGFALVPLSSRSFPQNVSWVTVCSVSAVETADPIVFPGQPGQGHSHTFSGALNVDAFSTADTLKAGDTNCTNKGDHAAYWMPTLFSGGEAKMPYTTRVYYRAGTFDTRSLRPIPFGLKMVAGSATATVPQSAGIAGFHCREEDNGPTVSKQALPPQCPTNSLFEASVSFPNCWDGVHLDSADHRSHMAYAKNYICDQDHPVMIPQITIAERFKPGDVDGGQVTLAAMPGMTPTNVTLHADFINAWDEDLMKQLMRDCLRASRSCAGVTDRRMPPVSAE